MINALTTPLSDTAVDFQNNYYPEPRGEVIGSAQQSLQFIEWSSYLRYRTDFLYKICNGIDNICMDKEWISDILYRNFEWISNVGYRMDGIISTVITMFWRASHMLKGKKIF